MAALSYPGVIVKISLMLVFLVSRSMLLPHPFNLLLLDFRGPIDEILFSFGVVHSIGVEKVKYSLLYAYDTWKDFNSLTKSPISISTTIANNKTNEPSVQTTSDMARLRKNN